MSNQLVLLPRPRELEVGGTVSLPERGTIAAPAACRFTAELLQKALRQEAGLAWEIAPQGAEGDITLRLVPGDLSQAQGYRLTVAEEGIEIVAAEAAGAFYGAQTLIQLLAGSGRQLPALTCRDWPDFENRGVMLDISRNKVPTMETLLALVDLLASWKVNQFQLYTEHTFAYRNHRMVWADASPVTAEGVRELDAYCRQRFVELVPNQNSFGHMRRWLVHDKYRHLAECPEGCDTVWGHFDEPFSLCPGDPGGLALLQELYDELLPNFSSRQFNVGCDETVDLGQGRSKEAVEARGEGRVYLDFLLRIYREVTARGRTMQFWGDVIMHHPELTPELPRDAIALEWGYEADHPFDRHGEVFAASGIPFYVCPGVSTWNTVSGRTDNALGNLRNAAENGLAHGAVGYLNTDWGDNGHLQPLPVSYLGYGYGAAVSWAYEANTGLDVARAVGRHAFRDAAGVMGQLAHDLGLAYREVGIPVPNATMPFRLLQATPEEIELAISGQGEELGDRLRATLERIDAVMAPLGRAEMARPDAALIQREFSWAAAMTRHGCRRALWRVGEVPVGELAEEARWLLAEHRAIWHARNRPGGFVDSQALLERMARDYD
jgi:hexosaminidase